MKNFLLISKKMNQEECPICLSEVKSKDKIITLCNHEFHKICLDMWNKKSNLCPICRKETFEIQFPIYKDNLLNIRNKENIVIYINPILIILIVIFIFINN